MSHRFVASFALVVASFFLLPATGSALSKKQQGCVNAINKSGAKVATAQGKANRACVKNAGNEKLGTTTAQACLTADPKGKVGKAKNKTVTTVSKKCPAPQPGFGFTSAAAVNSAAGDEEVTLVADVFGAPLEGAIILKSADKAGASCQSTAVKAYEKLAATRAKAFLKCKKSGLKDGTINSPATLASCVGDEGGGKVQKAAQKLTDLLGKKCGGVSLTAAFPGSCQTDASSSAQLAGCIARNVACRSCLTFNAADGVEAPCDQLDDNNLNGTCRQCGNGFTEAPEQCDDSGESATCDADCTVASCGDGTLNTTAGEECDDSGESATCDTDCTAAVCGDSTVNTTAGEECDDGGESASCDTDCTAAVCGDSTVNTTAGEVCDDGGESATCDVDCSLPVCGDGVLNVTAGEVCDDGNLVDGDGCDSNCTPTACGNGIVTAGEQCDDSGESATCDVDCSFATCGDGTLNTTAGEQCDDAGESATCDADCTLAACGDGTVNATAGEQCDDAGESATCDADCTTAVCGDGTLNTTAGEICDDGGESATCDVDCTPVVCGDGVLNTTAGEVCDDGNLTDGDGCDSNCTLTACGNGIVTAGEQCDDAGESATCDADCTTAVCGDGTLNTTAGEQCDDAGESATCDVDCTLAVCGDGTLNTTAGEICDDGGESATCDVDCTPAVCGDGVVNTTAGEICDDGGESATCDVDCTPAVCGDGVVNTTAGEECDDGNTVGGDGCSAVCTCSAGSGEVGCQAAQCPDQGEVILFAGVGRTCTTSAECPVGSCDPLLGRCVTPTELDTGQTGIAHDADTNDEILTRGRLLCPGPASPTCGQCEVLGIDPAPGNCRCENDNRQICDQPFQADATNCGGAVCNCYFGPPFPLSSGNTPACVVNRFAQDISGTGNVDTGDGQIDAKLRSQVFLGLTLIEPCPFCTGDVTANDGLRDGTCVDGPNDGQSCDVSAVNTSFPAPGGDGYSLDCFPPIGKNVSGQGLQINLSQTTGSVSMSSNVDCGFPFFGSSCPCRQCSGDTTVPCNSDAECAAAGLGSCSSLGGGSGQTAGPNGCSLGVCNDIGGGEGECNSGPDDTFCDGVVRSNGEGFIGCQTQRKCSLAPNPQCTTNADCTGGTDTCEFLDCKPGAIGIDAGDCLATKRRECFLDPIVATGTPDPNAPVGVAVFCIPPTGNAGINGVAGLPGAGRVKNQATARTFCASDPTVQYQPGVGGCP